MPADGLDAVHEATRGATAEAQCAGAVLVVRPATFAANPETRATNAFQGEDAHPADASVRDAVLAEFDGLVARLESHVRVHVHADTPSPPKPDATFPNNWFSTHADGTVVLYPMLAPSRRLERRRELLDALAAEGPYRVARVVDLSPHEAHGEFLEGTGSLVLDRVRRVAYACRSARTHAAPLAAFARALDYEVVAFDAVGPDGAAVYHTNVVMWVGDAVAAVCADAIPDARERRAVLDRLGADREVVTLGPAQMAAYAGNVLALRTAAGGRALALSARAEAALDGAQRSALRRLGGELLAAPIPTIERLGGGSVRCMLAEVFLPPA